MYNTDDVIHIDPEILGGTPVFIGTRVPLQALIDYIEGGHPLSDFLDDFPTVTHAQAVAALDDTGFASRFLADHQRCHPEAAGAAERAQRAKCA